MTFPSPFRDPFARIIPWDNKISDGDLIYKGGDLGEGALNSIKYKLERYGICIVRLDNAGFITDPITPHEIEFGIPEWLDPILEALQENLGETSDEQSGIYTATSKYIPTDSNADILSGNTPSKLQVHVDGAHLDRQPAIVILQYLVTANVGGSLHLVDMANVLEQFYLESPDQYDQIINSLSEDDALTFEKLVDKKIVINTGAFFWNTPNKVIRSVACRARFDSKVKPKEAIVKLFEDIKHKVTLDSNRIKVTPRPGDIFIIDNWRVLHGRSKYSSQSARKHRRLWIKSLSPRAGAEIYLGVRPVTITTDAQSAGKTSKKPDPSNQARIGYPVKEHELAELHQYRLERIKEWSHPLYNLDTRFVNLTMLLDTGESEQQRWQTAKDFQHNDLLEVLKKTEEFPVLVLLGTPGSGKSTLLRRLQLDHSEEHLRDDTEEISFFVQLNGYGAHADSNKSQKPREWLNRRWTELYSKLPPLETYLQTGRTLLLLDGLNEMPHQSISDYHALVGLWRAFAQDAAAQGNRIVFSCRSLYYGACLSSPHLPVPQVNVQPMSANQVHTFLKEYIPAYEPQIWPELDGKPQFSLYQNPFFLKLLCGQVEAKCAVPKGRAALFTGFVRQALVREVNSNKSKLFQPGPLLDKIDHEKLSLNQWRNAFDLPERGALIRKLSDLAFSMQQKGGKTEGAQLRVSYDAACDFMGDESILEAGEALSVLDRDVAQEEIFFFHQLLQEFFAARQLARSPNPELNYIEWAVDKVSEKLEDTLSGLADGDPLPPLDPTGWEETTLISAPMAVDPQAFLLGLIPHNLPLAGCCASSPEVSINSEIKREIQNALIARTRDMRADLRARISAGEALGLIGDPRFVRCTGPYGDYLLPPLVEIPDGMYQMGLNNAPYPYDREEPAHIVRVPLFQIGQFPVTNAEYSFFMKAGGYDDEQWWDTPESLAWQRGKLSNEVIKQDWREFRENLKAMSEDEIRDLVPQKRSTTRQVENRIEWRNWSDERFEQQLDKWLPKGILYRQPEFWDDTRFNNPAQPVIGVNWFESRAYCNWLTANVRSNGTMNEHIFRLPTEAEYEVAVRGSEGQMFPYGMTFDVSRNNTFESHIRRTTPVGIFDNATPEGAFDLSGNTYTWTSSIYDQQKFPYPYRSGDGRENIHESSKRVLRGGSWYFTQVFARAVFRDKYRPARRSLSSGFRVVRGFEL